MELTKNDIRNLLILLKRVSVNGEEAFVLVDICNKLQEMLKKPDEVKEE